MTTQIANTESIYDIFDSLELSKEIRKQITAKRNELIAKRYANEPVTSVEMEACFVEACIDFGIQL